MRRVTKREAEQFYNVSPSTLDRMIERGEVAVEREQHKTRHRVYVLIGDGSDGPVDASDNGSPDPSGDMSLEAKLAAAQERIRGLEELSGYHRRQLDDSEWRYRQLLQQLEGSQLTIDRLTQRMLPPSDSAPEGEPRRWWRFWQV